MMGRDTSNNMMQKNRMNGVMSFDRDRTTGRSIYSDMIGRDQSSNRLSQNMMGQQMASNLMGNSMRGQDQSSNMMGRDMMGRQMLSNMMGQRDMPTNIMK